MGLLNITDYMCLFFTTANMGLFDIRDDVGTVLYHRLHRSVIPERKHWTILHKRLHGIFYIREYMVMFYIRVFT